MGIMFFLVFILGVKWNVLFMFWLWWVNCVLVILLKKIYLNWYWVFLKNGGEFNVSLVCFVKLLVISICGLIVLFSCVVGVKCNL